MAIRNHYRAILRTLKARWRASLDTTDKKEGSVRESSFTRRALRMIISFVGERAGLWSGRRQVSEDNRSTCPRDRVRTGKTPTEVVSCCPLRRQCKPKLPCTSTQRPWPGLKGGGFARSAFSLQPVSISKRTPKIWARRLEYRSWMAGSSSSSDRSSPAVIDPDVSDAHLRPKIKDGKQGARCVRQTPVQRRRGGKGLGRGAVWVAPLTGTEEQIASSHWLCYRVAGVPCNSIVVVLAEVHWTSRYQ